MRHCTEDVFKKDVDGHTIKILLNNGIYRHLRFSNNGSFNQRFDIVTYPGYLCYSGDMGCFVFSRLEDMFKFFRSDKPELQINPGYWEEKLEAVNRHIGAREYLSDLFTEKVEEHVKEWVEDCELTKDQEEDLRYEVEESVLRAADDGELEAHRVLSEFSHEIDEHRFEFSDTWGWELKGYTFHYIWACYAIVWAIQQYDAATPPLEVSQ